MHGCLRRTWILLGDQSSLYGLNLSRFEPIDGKAIDKFIGRHYIRTAREASVITRGGTEDVGNQN